MRVLLLISGMHPRNGGPPAVVYGTAIALKARGLDVEVASLVAPCDSAEVRAAWPGFEDAGIPFHLFPIDPPATLIRSHACAAFVSESIGRFDLLHAHGVWEGVLANAGRQFYDAGKPYLVSVHGTLDPWSLRQSRLKKRLSMRLLGTRAYLDRAAGIVFGTDDERHSAAPLKLAPPAPVIPNGIELATLNHGVDGGRLEVWARFPETASWKRTVVFYSRIHPKKGLDLLLEAFGRVASRFPDCGVLAAGIRQDRAYEAGIRTRIEELGLSARFVMTTDFVGPAGRAVLDAANIFALPSHQEGFSMAIIEAMALGLPVLITDKCHMAEIAVSEAGVVAADTVEGIAKGLDAMLERSSDELAAMGEAGRRLVHERYTWTKVAAELELNYSAALAHA